MTSGGCVVLLSGGLDSLVALAEAARVTSVRLALTFDYGQRALPREVAAAARAAAWCGCAHRVVALPWLGEVTTTCLVRESLPVPETDAERVDGDDAGDNAAAVWVPNRNGVFVAVAASFAEALEIPEIYAGFNAEEAATFPDNGPAFVAAANRLLSTSTLRALRLVAPFSEGHDKTQIVARGVELGVPWEAFWSCYLSGDDMCGRCESCVRAIRALRANGLDEVARSRFEA